MSDLAAGDRLREAYCKGWGWGEDHPQHGTWEAKMNVPGSLGTFFLCLVVSGVLLQLVAAALQ